jgi:ubiquinone/menaquinone biosynthesis C-methylase UbiE
VLLESIRGKDILDIGCGFGWFELYCASHAARKVVGLEPSSAELRTAWDSVQDSRILFQEGDALDLPFEANSFDTVCIWDVIEHLPRKRETTLFREIARVVRPGGKIYLSTPFRSHLARAFDPAFWLLGHRHYNERELRKLGEGSGLLVEEVTVRGSFFEVVMILNLYFSKWILRRAPLFQESLARKQDREYDRPAGYMTIFVRYGRPNQEP